MRYVIAFLCAIIIVVLAAPVKGAGIATKDFFRQSNFNGITLSPKGDKVAFVPGLQGEKPTIVIWNLDDESSTLVPLSGTKPYGPLSLSLGWVNNNRLVISVGTSVLAIDADGSAATNLLAGFHNNERFSDITLRHFMPGDPNHVLIQARASRSFRMSNFSSMEFRNPAFRMQRYAVWNFYKLNVYTGERELVFSDKEGFRSFAFDREGAVRAGLKVSGRREEIQIRSADAGWQPIEEFIAHDSLAFSLDPDADMYGQRVCTFLEFGYNPDVLYFSANLSGDKIGIYELNLSDTSIRPVAPLHHTYDLVNFSSESPSKLLFSQRRKKLVGFRFAADRPIARWTDAYFRAVQSALDTILPANVNSMLAWNREETIFLIHSHSSQSPGTYYVFNTASKVLRAIGFYNEALADAELAPMLPISFESRDSLTIHGYLTLPPERDSQPLPLVVYPHGGPWWRDIYGYNGTVQLLAHHGYAVLQVNFRGSTGYGYRHFTAARENFGVGIINDLRDGIKHLVNAGLADPERIAIMGSSYGGYASMLMLSHYPDLFRCGISLSGVYDLKQHIDSYAAASKTINAYATLETMLGSRETLDRISPINRIEHIASPVMLVHGSDDWTVSPAQAENMYARLRRANKDARYLVLENEGHNGWHLETTTRVYETVLAFLDEHLGTGK